MRELHAGDIVGGYRLEARVGGGGFGSVWRARHVGSGRIVAVKVLPDTGADDASARIAADLELLAASAAGRSIHVVQVLDGGVDPVPYVVTEFISGTSLEEELRQRRRLPPDEVIDIGLAIADALGALEDAGIVHRDVKPSNVMIDRAGVVKLTDFGIAKIVGFDSTTVTGQLPLSISYAAPEVWEGKAEHRSDIYAFGIVLYHCLSGGLPFRGGYAELFYHHRSTEPDLSVLPPETPPSLTELIRRCLQKHPDDRPRDASQCATLLRQARDELPTEVYEQRPTVQEPERFGPWLKLEPHPRRAWSWICRHEQTGESAVVELFFAADLEFGQMLRRAVAANARLVPLGAQRLLGMNRLILRPGEAWSEPPPGSFQFWLAREDLSLPAPAALVTPPLLLRSVEALIALIEAAQQEGVPLNLGPEQLSILPEGSIYVADTGIAAAAEDAEAQAIGVLRHLPLTPELRPIVSRSNRLEDIRKAVVVLVEVQSITGAPVQTRPRPLVAGGSQRGDGRNRPRLPLLFGLLGAAVMVAIAAAGVFLAGGDDGDGGQVVVPPVNTPAPAAEIKACRALELPTSLAEAKRACGPAGASFVIDTACARGTACSRRTDSKDNIVIGESSRTIAFVDEGGNLALASAEGDEVTRLTGHGHARDPVWSPDGRYIAYVQVQPVGPDDADPPRYSTQLRVIEADRPGNDGIVMATNSGDAEPDWRRYHILSPQWSPDGTHLYFLVATPDGGSAGLYSLALRLRDGSTEIDFAVLRGAAPATESILPPGVSTLVLDAADFGVPDGFLGRFVVGGDGAIYVQVCDGPHENRRCGLGRWDGNAAMLLPIEDDVALAPPAPSTALGEALLVPIWRRDIGWRLLSLPPGGQPRTYDVVLTAPEDVFGFPVPRIAMTDGDSAAVITEAPSTRLQRIDLASGASTPYGSGLMPVSYRPGLTEGAPSLPAPPVQAWSTPTPTPTQTTTVTPTPRITPTPLPDFRPMTLFIFVRRGSTALSNAEVVALIDGNDCASGRTDAAGRLTLTFPRADAPAACAIRGAAIFYRVNGEAVPNTNSYSPQGVFSIEIVLP